MKLVAFLASIWVLVVAIGCSAPPGDDPAAEPPDEPQEHEPIASRCQGLIDAPLDATNTSAVGLCTVPLTTEPGGELTCGLVACSATLIAKNLVLTARHCVQGGTLGFELFEGRFSEPVTSPAFFNVTLSSSGAIGNPSWYPVDQVLVPDSTDPSNDIALVILKDTIEPRDAVPAGVDLTTNLAALDHPTEFTILGRGAVHYDLDAQGQIANVDSGDFQRRILQHVPFICASDSASTPCVSFSLRRPPTYMLTLPLEYFSMGRAALRFDSGGGIFAQQSDESCLPRVVAVTSATTTGEDGLPASTLGVRVGRFADFLRAGAETAAQLGNYEKPEWADD